MSREQTLKLFLSDLKKDYDYILIDCMQSLGMLTINALATADMRTRLARATAYNLNATYGQHIRIFKTVILVVTTAAESSAAGKSIYTYDKDGTVAQAYAEFTREVMQCGERQRNKHESSISR